MAAAVVLAAAAFLGGFGVLTGLTLGVRPVFRPPIVLSILDCDDASLATAASNALLGFEATLCFFLVGPLALASRTAHHDYAYCVAAPVAAWT